MLKRMFCIFCILLMAASMLTGCVPNVASQNTTTAAEQPKEATVSLWYTANEADPNDVDNVWITETLELFAKEYPHIKIEKTVIGGAGGENYRAKLAAEIASGNTPDIFMTWMAQSLAPFVKQKAVMPLNDIVEQDPELKAMINLNNMKDATFDGKYYSIPGAISLIGLFYNKEIFNKYNLQVPKSVDELYNVSKVFKENGLTPIALGNNVKWVITIPYMTLLCDNIGYDEYNRRVAEQDFDFSKQEFKDAMTKLVEIVNQGVFTENFNAIAPAESKAVFENGEAAMFLQGTWNASSVEKALGEKAGFTSFPTISGEQFLVKTPSKGFAVAAQPKEKDAVLTLFKFMHSKERQAAFAKVGNIPALNGISLDPATTGPLFKELVALNESPVKGISQFDDVAIVTAVKNEFRNTVQACTAGDDINTLFDNLQKFMEMNK